MTGNATVAERLAANQKARNEIYSTPCANCGHPWHEHGQRYGGLVKGKCWHPLVRALSDDKPCRCKSFRDRVEPVEEAT